MLSLLEFYSRIVRENDYVSLLLGIRDAEQRETLSIWLLRFFLTPLLLSLELDLQLLRPVVFLRRGFLSWDDGAYPCCLRHRPFL